MSNISVLIALMLIVSLPIIFLAKEIERFLCCCISVFSIENIHYIKCNNLSFHKLNLKPRKDVCCDLLLRLLLHKRRFLLHPFYCVITKKEEKHSIFGRVKFVNLLVEVKSTIKNILKRLISKSSSHYLNIVIYNILYCRYRFLNARIVYDKS